MRCRAEGYDVVVIDREGDGIRADLSSPKATAAALDEALRDGPITRLVNNVGVVRPGPVEEQTLPTSICRLAQYPVQPPVPASAAARHEGGEFWASRQYFVARCPGQGAAHGLCRNQSRA